MKNLAIAYTIELVTDYSSPYSTATVDKQGEGKYKQFQKILKWKNALIRSKSDIYKVYQDGIDGNIAREYIDKKGVNSLYNRLDETKDLDYYKLKSGDDVLKFNAMRTAFSDILEADTKNSAIRMIKDYADYFNIRAGRFENRYSEKNDKEEGKVTKSNTNILVNGFDGVKETFKEFLYMVKIFDNIMVPNLDIGKELVLITDSKYDKVTYTTDEKATLYYKLLIGNDSVLGKVKLVDGTEINLAQTLAERHKSVLDNFATLK